MIPQILNIGPFPINSFGLFVALALLTGIFCLARSFKLNGLEPAFAEKYVLTGGFVGLLGARIWYIFSEWDESQSDLLSAIFSGAGFVFYGGFVFSTVTLITMSFLDKFKLDKFLDSLGPTLALGYAIGRIGCQLSGDGDYGVPTTGFWGMSYATGVIPTAAGIRAFPAPVFESIMACGIFLILISVEKKESWKIRPFSRFTLYLALIAGERFLIEFIRRNKKFDIGFGALLSQAQIISVVIIVIAGVMIISQSQAHKNPDDRR